MTSQVLFSTFWQTADRLHTILTFYAYSRRKYRHRIVMVYCAAFGCNNEAQKGNGISFFTFPKDIHLRKAWTHYCRRWDFVPKSDHRLCSVHFFNNCYAMDPDTFANLGMAASFKRRLKPWCYSRCASSTWQRHQRWREADHSQQTWCFRETQKSWGN